MNAKFAKIHAIFVGRPRRYATGDDSAKPWTSAIVKTPVLEPVFVSRTNLSGDQQADLVHHGGPDKAVMAYSHDHYEAWNRENPELEMQAGGFGENLSLCGVDESSVCIGDT
ncbi:MAG: MOSC domain-containing protein, partial [Pirellulales bacterium]|nr:MOSC domain-containing protein [Pirellulales bacterium]